LANHLEEISVHSIPNQRATFSFTIPKKMLKQQNQHCNPLKENKLSELKSLTLLTKWIFWMRKYGTCR